MIQNIQSLSQRTLFHQEEGFCGKTYHAIGAVHELQAVILHSYLCGMLHSQTSSQLHGYMMNNQLAILGNARVLEN